MRSPICFLASVTLFASASFASLYSQEGVGKLIEPDAAQKETNPETKAETTAEEKLPRPRTTYLGRRIAATMSYRGADWLFRPERFEEENPNELLQQLGLQAGMNVCDLGCGSGFYTLTMAKSVAPGRVYAVDIQPEMLRLLEANAKNDYPNLQLILGTPVSPELPAGKIDLVLMVDVYHEFAYPEEMLRSIRESLSPTGVIALAEYREEDPRVPIKPLHKMSKQQILKEYTANGYKLVREYDKLPWQHLMFFSRDEQWQPPTDE